MIKPSTSRPALLDQLSALSDPTRSRVLLVLERQELTVSELCTVLRLPQSTVSRHLKILEQGGWASARREGTHRLYRLATESLEPSAGQVWQIARLAVAEQAAAGRDLERLDGVMAARRARSREFFAGAADRWDRRKDVLFGPRFWVGALLGLLDPRSEVADLGCGTGPVSEALSPFVARVVAVDDSAEMLEAARRRLDGKANVELRRGTLEALPLLDGEVDAATMILVLHHLPDPGRALAEVSRVLRPGGRLLLVDMLPHERAEYRQEMGHVWLGFSPEQIHERLAAAGLRGGAVRPLPALPDAEGPTLFVATAVRPGERRPATLPDPTASTTMN